MKAKEKEKQLEKERKQKEEDDKRKFKHQQASKLNTDLNFSKAQIKGSSLSLSNFKIFKVQITTQHQKPYTFHFYRR